MMMLTPLNHEALDVPMEDDTIVVVAGTQCQKVFTCFWGLHSSTTRTQTTLWQLQELQHRGMQELKLL
jgi:hypothetical protein